MSITPYTFDLEPGQTKHQTFGEANYIFVDFADRTIEVSINNEWQSLRKGSRYRSKTGLFDRFSIRNPDANNPARVIMFIGTDEVDNQIVEGEISIVPVLRSADGTTRPDTRQLLDIDVLPQSLVTTAYLGGDDVDVGPNIDNIITEEGDPQNESGSWVFPGPNGTYVFHKYVSGFSVGGMNFYDKNLNLVDRNDYAPGIPGNALPLDVLYNPDHGYLSLAPGNVIYQYQPDNTRTQFATLPAVIPELQTWCYIERTDQYAGFSESDGDFGSYRSIVLIDKDFNLVAKIEAINIGNEAIRYNELLDELWLFSTSQLRRYRLSDLSFIEQIGTPFNQGTGKGGVADNDTLMVTRYSSPTALRRVAAYDFVTKPTFRALRHGCDRLYLNRKLGSLPQITAEITATASAQGVRLSGEVIRAALEYYFGKKAPDDYLDHIYQFDVSNGVLGAAFKPVSSGNETFAAAAIADNFKITVPARIRLMIDNEITLGGAL